MRFREDGVKKNKLLYLIFLLVLLRINCIPEREKDLVIRFKMENVPSELETAPIFLKSMFGFLRVYCLRCTITQGNFSLPF